MLKIRKDGTEIIVSEGAFENLYKSMGFEVVNEKAQKSVEKFEDDLEYDKPEEQKDDIEEKPKRGNK